MVVQRIQVLFWITLYYIKVNAIFIANVIHWSTNMELTHKRSPPRSIRLKPELLAWIAEKAQEGDRSINAEINRQLRKAKEAEEHKPSEAA